MLRHFITRLPILRWRWPVVLLLSGSCSAAELDTSLGIPLLQRLTFLALLLLAAAVAALLRSRANLIASRRTLLQAREELEQRVIERTQSLHDSNLQLSAALARYRETEALLRDTQSFLHSILNSMPSALIGVSPEGRVTHWNSNAERLTGIAAAKALGNDLVEQIPQMVRYSAPLQEAIVAGKPHLAENQRDGEGSHAHYFDVTIYPLQDSDNRGAVIRIDNVTQRVRLENLMVQNEKMVALGELAAGMAHEINNPLSAILQGVQTVQRRLSSKLVRNRQVADAEAVELAAVLRYVKARKIGRLLTSVRTAGERAAAIVSNMLEFSRYSNRQRTYVDLIGLIQHSLELARPGFKLPHSKHQKIAVQCEFPTDEFPKVPCCAAEIQQVLLNLLRNASQALAEAADGETAPTIVLRLGRDNHDAIIDVIDNGPGIPEKVRRYIFDPFFTTKEVGAGTGLGLSISYYIVHEHHRGSIVVDSQPGAGSCFSVRLPLDTPDMPMTV